MAGALIKLEEVTVSSAVSSVILGDDKWDTSFDVYMVKFNNVKPVTNGADMRVRLTESGTPNTTSNYDEAGKLLRADTTFQNIADVNRDYWILSGSVDNGAGENLNNIMYIFNANNSSEYTFVTIESNYIDGNNFKGLQGGGVFTVTSQVDGVSILFDSGNIASGTFTLYGLKK
jgi:hypothetical protein